MSNIATLYFLLPLIAYCPYFIILHLIHKAFCRDAQVSISAIKNIPIIGILGTLSYSILQIAMPLSGGLISIYSFFVVVITCVVTLTAYIWIIMSLKSQKWIKRSMVAVSAVMVVCTICSGWDIIRSVYIGMTVIPIRYIIHFVMYLVLCIFSMIMLKSIKKIQS